MVAHLGSGVEDPANLEATADLGTTVRVPPRVGPALALPLPRKAPRTTLVGTPLYMAPEVWRGEPASARTDLYSLGILLYELCSGRTPHMANTVHELAQAIREQPAAPLAQVAPQVDPVFAALVDRCVAREPDERFASADALREALEALRETTREEAVLRERPYPGLYSFTAQDRATFFGRAAEVRGLLDRLRAEPLVLVTGDSGAGKSSLCRAGVMPRVAEGAWGVGGAWAVCELLPGRSPLVALAAALAPLMGTREAELLEVLRDAPGELGRRVRAREGSRGLLVFVDQLEEVLTLALPEDAERFALALGSLATGGPMLRVLATARSDFLARLAALPALGEAISRGLYLLQHLTEAGMREAIQAPARAQGFAFESEELVETLVTAGRVDGGLPLLQFALSELWERRDRERRVVPAAALVALGGVAGALARHADGVLASLLPGERAAARRVLLRMVTAEGTRARRTREELLVVGGKEDEASRAALEALVHGRLVLAREAAGEELVEGTYELAHEALLVGWDTLRGWLASDVEQRALRQRLERACAEWHRLSRTSELLWSARQLQETARLQETSLSVTEVAFLRASRRAVWRQRLGRTTLLLLLPFTAAAVYGTLELRARYQQEQAVVMALEEARGAMRLARDKDARVEVLRREAFTAFDAADKNTAETSWADALALSAEVDRTYDDASRVLDEALLRDGRDPRVRHLLAEILYERVLVAERDRRIAVRGEIERRLEDLDDTGEFRRLLLEPAHLQVESLPAGAKVLLERAVEDQGQLRWSPPESLGETPLQQVRLPPGSYRLTLQRPDRPAVLHPVLLGRGEHLRVHLPLPASVPAGYVYVPPGRFLYGSGDDEVIRRTLVQTRPLHPVETGGFLIGRHEVTYAEWLAFLRTLPPEEQARRRPQARHFFGNLDVSEQSDGTWEFRLERGGFILRAREGQRVHYPERDHRADQDWLRFPVAGISWADARAYLTWLDRSGRLRGARFCDEREWEHAARGADGRDYPNGNRLAPDDANVAITYGRKSLAFGPDEVGAHPASDSPFGVADLAGNVWEWMSAYTSREQAAFGGGSFYQEAFAARGLNHGDGEPLQRDPLTGLRVCAPPPEP